MGYIWRQSGLMLIFTVCSLAAALLNMYIAGNIAFKIGRELRDEIFIKVLSFSKTEYDRFGPSALIPPIPTMLHKCKQCLNCSLNLFMHLLPRACVLLHSR